MKLVYIILLSLILSIFASAKTSVATTTTDLEAVVKKVAGDQVDVFSIAKGTQDAHQIDAKPSFMVKLRNCDVVFAQGLELEAAWIVPLVQGSRNSKLLAKDGVFELGALLEPIEAAKGAVSRAEGDVHPGGNPHFQLDPVRIGKAAQLIAQRLSELDSSQKEVFKKNADAFQKEMIDKTKSWQARITKSGVKEIVTYHKNFSYFCDRFGIQCNLQLEPKPGIPPTAGHLISVIDQMKKRKINLVLIENLYEDSVGLKLKQDIPNVFVQRVPVSVEAEPGIVTNEQLIERVVKTIEQGSN